MRYVKVFLWTAICIVLLTVAQYGSVHLLTGRPSSWVFEASLDLGPPLLFAGDMVQFLFNNQSQAPLRDQPVPLALGLFVNICLYGFAALMATWLFFRSAPPRVALNAARRRR